MRPNAGERIIEQRLAMFGGHLDPGLGTLSLAAIFGVAPERGHALIELEAAVLCVRARDVGPANAEQLARERAHEPPRRAALRRFRPRRMVPAHKLPDFEQRKALRTTYADETADALVQARDALGVSAFRDLRDALVDPSRHASELGIDPHSKPQVFAARKYIKAALSVNPMHYPRAPCRDDQPTEVDYHYANKMASRDWGPDVSAKNKLLMAGDPVGSADVDLSSQHPLDIVLSRVHFATPRTVQETTYSDRAEPEVRVFGPSREEARRVIRGQLSNLYRVPLARSVMEALAAVIVREKAQVIFSGALFGTGAFAEPYPGASANVLGGTEGFYNNRHTIFLPATINAYRGSKHTRWVCSARIGSIERPRCLPRRASIAHPRCLLRRASILRRTLPSIPRAAVLLFWPAFSDPAEAHEAPETRRSLRQAHGLS